jgi:hypothetical protein
MSPVRLPIVETATREATIDAILSASQRSTVPIRHTFLQASVGREGRPAPLAALVRLGRAGALEQYLLLRAWSVRGGHDVSRSARVWSRAIGHGESEAGRKAVGRNWALLEHLGLIRRERAGRLVRVTVLSDDGSGVPYRHPGAARDSPYLQLPHAYWRQGWHMRLRLPGKALLLVSLSLGDLFWLPAHRAPAWYGFSASTAERGLRELRDAGLLTAVRVAKVAPLAPTGRTIENRFVLQPPFGPRGVLARGAPLPAERDPPALKLFGPSAE